MARNPERLKALQQDLTLRGAHRVYLHAFDATQSTQQEATLQKVYQTLPQIDIALLAYGSLPEQQACEQNIEQASAEWQINASSTIELLTRLSQYFIKQGQGTIAAISSVAGDRGRQSNYFYGAAKAALSTFLQGLRNRLYPHGIHVLTIKPGFIDTPMTAQFKKGLLWAQPEQVALDIAKAIERKKNTLYTPWFWKYIMAIIRLIPETIFKRLKL